MTVQSLYDFIDILPADEVGFEIHDNDNDGFVNYELVLPPAPQIKVLSDKEKTL